MQRHTPEEIEDMLLGTYCRVMPKAVSVHDTLSFYLVALVTLIASLLIGFVLSFVFTAVSMLVHCLLRTVVLGYEGLYVYWDWQQSRKKGAFL